MLCVGLMSEVTSRRPAPPVAYPKDRTRPDLADHTHFYSTTRHRAKSTAGTGRIGHGSATHQTANLCGKLNCASLPRPQGRAGALNLEDDSGRHEDLGTTERPHPSDGSYPERSRREFSRIPGRSVRGIHLLGRVSLLRILLSVISVLLTSKIFELCADFPNA